MKLRRESRGHHFYDRRTGLHILLDECPVSADDCDAGPELVSIALTNVCDLACGFCYAPKSNHQLPLGEVVGWCKQFASIGAFEVAFGGGEPTLYQGLGELCRRIWSESDIGISLTTHGHHLTNDLARQLEDHVSVVRISIDAPEPNYSAIRGRSLHQLMNIVDRVRGRFPIGINTVINSTTLPTLDRLGDIAQQMHAIDWLLLPETRAGEFTLSESEWATLDAWIGSHHQIFSLRVSTEAVPRLSGPFPLPDAPDSYVHISADGFLRRCSYHRNGIPLHGKSVEDALAELREHKNVCLHG